MSIKRHCRRIIIKHVRPIKLRLITFVISTIGILLCNVCFAADSSDPLKDSVKPQIQALFGADSTVAFTIYIAEIVLGSVAYIKTKNLLLLLGVPILVLFTHAMFTYISS